MVALDGERELRAGPSATASVTARGPRLVDIRRVLEVTAGAGMAGAERIGDG